MAAVEELGYVIHPVARALKRGGTGIVLLDLHGWTPSVALDRYVASLDKLLAQKDLSLLVHHGTGSASQLRKVAIQVAAHTVTSLRSFPPGDVAKMETAGIQVLAGGATAGPELGHERMQVQHLAARGHEVIAHARPADSSLDAMINDRRSATRRAARDLALRVAAELLVTDKPEANAAALAKVLARDPEITAIAAYNDDVALAVLAAARTIGLRVPDQLAVIGVDDIPLGALWSPALTTLALDYHRAAALTAAYITGAPTNVDTDHIYELRVRQST